MAVSVLLYGCTTWILTKCMERKLDRNYTRILHAVLNKPWKHHPTKQQLYDHIPPISNNTQVRWTRHAEAIFFDGPLHMDAPVLTDLQELIYISSVGTLDIVYRTCQEWWMIGMDGERVSRKCMLSAWLEMRMIFMCMTVYAYIYRHTHTHIYIYIYYI